MRIGADGRQRATGAAAVLLLCGVLSAAEPRLRERVVGADYDRRAAELLKQPLPDPAEPTEGVGVFAVDTDEAGAKAGLKGNDVIAAVDGQEVIGAGSYQRLRAAAQGDQKLDVWTPGRPGRRKVVVPPGDLGLTLADHWVPPLQYVRGLPVGAKPVDELRLAALACSTQPALAETALARFDAAGPDRDVLAATVAYMDADPDAARAFAAAAAPGLDGPRRRSADRILYRADLATFHWVDARRVLRADPDLAGPVELTDPPQADVLAEAVRDSADLPADGRPPDAVRAFEALSPVDQSKHLTNACRPEPDRDDVKLSGDDVFNFNHAGWTTFDDTSSTYDRTEFGPGGADVDLGVDVKFRPKNDKWSDWPKGVTVAVVPKGHLAVTVDDGTYADAAVSIRISAGQGASVVGGRDVPACVLSLGPLIEPNRPTHVRVTVAGRWGRVAVGRRTVWAGPVSPTWDEADRRLCGVVQSCSVVGQWRGLRWRTADAGK